MHYFYIWDSHHLQFFKEIYGGTFASEKVKPLHTGFDISILLSSVRDLSFNFHVVCTNARNSLAVQAAVDSALVNSENDKPIWAIVVVNNLDPVGGNVDYKIRMNFTTVPRTTEAMHKRRKGLRAYYKRYYTSGFLSLQVCTCPHGFLFSGSGFKVQGLKFLQVYEYYETIMLLCSCMNRMPLTPTFLSSHQRELKQTFYLKN